VSYKKCEKEKNISTVQKEGQRGLEIKETHNKTGQVYDNC
jgi:hypothetical protein